MTNKPPDKQGIPVLNDVVRRGQDKAAQAPHQSAPQRQSTVLSEAEIEAIAARVVERHSKRIEEAVARAISKAIEQRSGGSEP